MAGGIISLTAASVIARDRRAYMSLLALKRPPDTYMHDTEGADVCRGRNEAITQAISQNADWVFYLDDDQVFHSTLLLELLALEVPIVQPLVLRRDMPFMPLALGPESDIKGAYHRLMLGPEHTGLLPVSVLGGGCLLIRRVIWETLPAPWWEPGKNTPGRLEEDVTFCRKVREAGFQPMLCCDLTSGHATSPLLYPVRHEDGTWTTKFVFNDGQSFDIPAAIIKGSECVIGGR